MTSVSTSSAGVVLIVMPCEVPVIVSVYPSRNRNIGSVGACEGRLATANRVPMSAASSASRLAGGRFPRSTDTWLTRGFGSANRSSRSSPAASASVSSEVTTSMLVA